MRQSSWNGPASDSHGDAYSKSRLEGLSPRLGLIARIRPRGNQTSPPAIMSLSIGSTILANIYIYILNIYIYIYICMYVYIHMCLSMYREREVYMHIFLANYLLTVASRPFLTRRWLLACSMEEFANPAVSPKGRI